MTTKTRIEEKLTRAFAPTVLGVIDESDRHAGHSGWKEGGETHFRVEVVSKAFEGKSRVEAHRMVNEALAEELKNGVHALAIKASAG
ncbi:BolA family protein [Breoghania sp. JC706]|uniref:BolA family protein n=1 Tax=Breoghania sp. JC706 TaxID=3117732 RepID=UPI00300AF30D